MDSPLARMILTVFGGYLLILLGLVIYDWYREEFPSPPEKPQHIDPVQHPYYHTEALNVLKHYSGLPEAERIHIKHHLEQNLLSIEQWITELERSDYTIICLGEFHDESTRQFLAEEFFSSFTVDVLHLEANPKELRRLSRKMEAGREYFPLLEADIITILRAVRARNPHIIIRGIEETAQQEKLGKGRTRDCSLAENFWKRFHPEATNIILFGAAHCSNDPHWLYGRLRSQALPSLDARMLNVRILGEHQSGPIEGFVFFLDEIGVTVEDFVLSDTGSLYPHIHEWFSTLRQQILEKFQALVVFRS